MDDLMQGNCYTIVTAMKGEVKDTPESCSHMGRRAESWLSLLCCQKLWDLLVGRKSKTRSQGLFPCSIKLCTL